MILTSIAQLSLVLMNFSNALADDVIDQQSHTEKLQKQVSFECTETRLQYSVGGKIYHTSSRDCDTKPQFGNPTEQAKINTSLIQI